MTRESNNSSVRKPRVSISIRALKIVLFVAILLGIALILKDVDLRQTLSILGNMNYVLLVWVFMLGGVNIFLFALRWYFLLKVVKSNVSFKNIIIATIGAIAINSSGPGKLGVPAKAMLIKKLEGIEVNQSVPSILMEIFFEIFVVAMMLLVSAFAIGMHDMIFKFVATTFIDKNILYLGGFLLFVIFIIYLLRRKLTANQFIGKLIGAFKKTLTRKDIFVMGVGISVANLLVHFWADQLLFKALQQDIPYGFIVFSSAFSAMAGLISPLPGGLGVWELSRAYLFKTYYGIGELAVIMTLLRRLLTYSASGVIYLVNELLVARNRSLTMQGMPPDKVLQNSVAGD